MTLLLAMASSLKLWLPQDVAERLREAAATLQRLPMPKNGRPGECRSIMPEPLTDFWGMWNGLTAQEREERRRDFNRTRIPATAEQIRRMDEALNWLMWLSERDRKAVMAKAGGASYRKISYFDHRNREHLRQVWARSCEIIAGRLNDG